MAVEGPAAYTARARRVQRADLTCGPEGALEPGAHSPLVRLLSTPGRRAAR